MTRRLIAVAACVLVWGAACHGAQAESKPKAVKKVATFRLRGSLVEMPRGMDLSLFDLERKTLRGLVERMDKAGKDEEVVGAVLLLDDVTMGWGQVQELRAAIQRLRDAGKQVYCHLAAGGMGNYLVAAACDRISMVPSGTLLLTGIAAEEIYLKGLLDKLGVKGDLLHCGAYKGAAEPLTRTGPSKESQEQMERVLGDYYAQLVEMIAHSRRLRPEDVREWIDKGPLTARHAAAANLVDELLYRHEFMRKTRSRFENADVAKDYGQKKGPEIDFASPFGFFSLFKEMMKRGEKKGKNVIALVYIEGMIMTGRSGESLFGDVMAGSDTLRGALLRAAEDTSVKGIILRVDSPGGSALASDIIHEATQVVRKVGKPLVVSMGDVAASGGYYVSTGADAIFAEPGTLTGSIGVVGGKIVLGGLFDKIGINTHTYTFGRNADLFNMTRPFDERQRNVVMELMTDTYEQFKRRVTAGRGNRLKGDIDDLAGGRIYTGREALKKGLVDKLGGLNDAIRYLAAEAKLKDYEIRVMPRPKTLFDYINEALGLGDDEEDASAGAHTEPPRWLDAYSGATAAIPVLGHLAPREARALLRMLWRIELLRREGVLTVTPSEWVIH